MIDLIVLLTKPNPEGTTFKILLIASEILIPLIVFIGAYFIFKPVFDKTEKEAIAKKVLQEQEKLKQDEADSLEEKSGESESSSEEVR